jgi:hypothetical protein
LRNPATDEYFNVNRELCKIKLYRRSPGYARLDLCKLFHKAHNKIVEMGRCYGEIYEEKKRAIVQSSLDKFVRKAERPAASTSRQPSTSFSEPEQR